MLPEQFVIFSALLSSIGGFTYIRDTLQGKTKPNKVSWFLWALAPLVAFFIQKNEGVGWANLLTFMVGFLPLLIFISSFVNKKSYWKITKFDCICGVLSIIGISIYIFTSNAIISVFLLILADGLAVLPTLKKSLEDYTTESYMTFLLGMFGSTIVILSIHHYSFLYLGFPIYIFIADTLLFLFMYPKTNNFLRKYIFRLI
jgi:hypothetical protein